MNPTNPILRFFFGVVLVAVAIRVSWLLIQPALPVIVAVLVVLGIVRAISWYRGRW